MKTALDAFWASIVRTVVPIVVGVVSLLTSIASGTRTGTPSFSQSAPHDDTLRA